MPGPRSAPPGGAMLNPQPRWPFWVQGPVPPRAVAAPLFAFIQAIGNHLAAPGTTIAATYASNPTTGDLLWCRVTWDDITATCTVADGLNGAWTPIGTPASIAGPGRSQMFYRANAIAGATTVTATTNITTGYRNIVVGEWSGIATTSPLDANNQATGTSAAPAVSLTTTTDHCLIIGEAGCSGTGVAGAGFNSRLVQDGNPVEDLIDLTPAGAINVTFTQAPSGAWNAAVAAFKPVAALAAPISGTSSGLGGASGAFTATSLVTGTADGLGATTGGLTATALLTGTAAGTGTATGGLTATALITGATAGTGAATGTVSILIPPQVLLPSADSVAGAWTNDTGGTALAAAIAEPVASDANYIRSEIIPSLSSCRVHLAAGVDPFSSVGHAIRWRASKDTTNGHQIDMTVTLRQGGGNVVGGGTLIASFSRTNVDPFTDYSETLSGVEADAITNYTDLYLEFKANQV